MLGENHPALQDSGRQTLAEELVKALRLSGIDVTDGTIPLPELTEAFLIPTGWQLVKLEPPKSGQPKKRKGVAGLGGGGLWKGGLQLQSNNLQNPRQY